MDLDEARTFLRSHHRGILVTARPDGRPQMSAVSVALDEEGRPAISTREGAYKVRRIREDPQVSLCVMSEDFWSWIQIDGTATVISLPEAMEALVAQYRAVAGEHPDWDDYRASMQDQQRVIIRIDMERAGTPDGIAGSWPPKRVPSGPAPPARLRIARAVAVREPSRSAVRRPCASAPGCGRCSGRAATSSARAWSASR